jgi:hypothetical protein
VQYSRKNWLVLPNYCSEKFFLTPKMVHWPKIFWRRGGGRLPILLCSKKKFLWNFCWKFCGFATRSRESAHLYQKYASEGKVCPCKNSVF